MSLQFHGEPLRILDFDIECRPLSWYGGDWVTKEVTAIAWAWVPTPTAIRDVGIEVHSKILGEFTRPNNRAYGRVSVRDILSSFLEAYNEADMVTGHFIRGFDLPVLNSALLEEGMPLLGDKLTHDTKGDLRKFSGLSKSQENMGALLGLDHPKVQMDQAKWRRANRLLPEGLEEVRQRVRGDVLQHIEMRQALMDARLLGDPKLWTSSPSRGSKYVP